MQAVALPHPGWAAWARPPCYYQEVGSTRRPGTAGGSELLRTGTWLHQMIQPAAAAEGKGVWRAAPGLRAPPGTCTRRWRFAVPQSEAKLKRRRRWSLCQ